MPEAVAPEAETKKLLSLIGEAISEWSFVEQALSILFHVSISPVASRKDGGGVVMVDSRTTTAAFYAIESFRGKLRLVDASFVARFEHEGDWAKAILNDWRRLHNKVGILSRKRNMLAHWTVSPASSSGDPAMAARLMPPYGSPKWFKETGSNPSGDSLSAKEVDDAILAFGSLREKITDFYQKLASMPEVETLFDTTAVRQFAEIKRFDEDRFERLRNSLSLI